MALADTLDDEVLANTPRTPTEADIRAILAAGGWTGRQRANSGATHSGGLVVDGG
jgi:hypothetical protein